MSSELIGLVNSDIGYIHEFLENKKIQSRLVNIIDGDTIICIIELNKSQFFKFRARLCGVDTSEMKGSNKENAILARQYVINRLCGKHVENYSKKELELHLNTNPVIIDIIIHYLDKYGRLLIDIFIDNTTISLDLIERGLGKSYNGGKKEDD